MTQNYFDLLISSVIRQPFQNDHRCHLLHWQPPTLGFPADGEDIDARGGCRVDQGGGQGGGGQGEGVARMGLAHESVN